MRDQNDRNILRLQSGLGKARDQNTMCCRPEPGVDQDVAAAGLDQQGVDAEGNVIGRLAGGFKDIGYRIGSSADTKQLTIIGGNELCIA